jgi:hypothetical protein
MPVRNVVGEDERARFITSKQAQAAFGEKSWNTMTADAMGASFTSQVARDPQTKWHVLGLGGAVEEAFGAAWGLVAEAVYLAHTAHDLHQEKEKDKK